MPERSIVKSSMELTLLNSPTGYSIVGPNGTLMASSLTEAELAVGVVDQCRAKHLHVWEIQFGAKDSITGTNNDNTGEKYANMRAAMYGALRSWVKGAMLPKDNDLRNAMLAIRYTFNKNDMKSF